MKLNRSRPFGKIAGDVFIPDGCDRPALYEQDGRFFDAHDRLIVVGETASIVPSSDDDEVDGEAAPTMTVADLLRQADTMHWRTFKVAAGKVLGAECPATKATIIEALQAVQKEFDARAARRGKDRGTVAAPGRQPQSGLAASGVDLAAWGRGQRDYLWGEVRKAMKTEFGRAVTERDDAVDFLIQQGVITAGEARQDVIREAGE
jgi:hypothetical protein